MAIEVAKVELKSVSEAAAEGQANILDQPGHKEYIEARELILAGNRDEARAKLVEAVTAMPDLVPALAALGELDCQAGRFEEALDAARKCLEVDDEASDCLAVAANASQGLGDPAGR